MVFPLKNKVVLITGSSIGIGREDAYLFARERCRVIITYFKDKTEAGKVEKKCIELGASSVLVLKLDITDNENIESVVKQTVNKFGKIDILVNNAGYVARKDLKDQTNREIEEQIRTNLEGLIKMTKACLPYLQSMVINIGSGAALTGFAQLATYGATKWGVRGFTKALAAELPHLKFYTVHPVITATRMRDFTGMPPEKVAEVIVSLAKGKYNLESGSDVYIPDYVK